ncbi:MbtH family NRPS accessory protein [Streptomyces racemochromogenes]|uniref:MbtH family NRPS accessory protein n=1 Tax=Streptomyces racemochromogenes TaxID=67353 RepID=A0ABW7PG35_9ACTN
MHEQSAVSTHTVVVNRAEQYSIWPAGRRPPVGWRTIGPPASRETCLGFIARTWTDMRPLELRRTTESPRTRP